MIEFQDGRCVFCDIVHKPVLGHNKKNILTMNLKIKPN